MAKIDKIDRQILSLLQENCRITVKEMSDRLGLSSTPIFERIKKLEKSGVINRYVAILNQQKLDQNLTVFLHVSLKNHSRDAIDTFLKEIIQVDEVMECYHVTGDFDFFLKVVTRDMNTYNDFILNKLSVISNLGQVRSQFSLSERKRTTAFRL